MADQGPGVRLPPPLAVGGLVLLGWLLHRQLPIPLAPPLPGAALGLMALGLGLSAWTVLAMLRAGTDPRPDKPDSTLLPHGPFRLSRNPIYLGFLLVAGGFALHWGGLWPWLAVLGSYLWLDRQVVAREETYLRARFGADYARYAAQVRRWL